MKLTDILRKPHVGEVGEIEPTNAAAGRELKQLRERLALTMEEAGALANPPINKGVVSRLEARGKGERFNDYQLALNLAHVKRRKAEIDAAKAHGSGAINQEMAALDMRLRGVPDDEIAARLHVEGRAA